jgi:hypothetical protein
MSALRLGRDEPLLRATLFPIIGSHETDLYGSRRGIGRLRLCARTCDGSRQNAIAEESINQTAIDDMMRFGWK